MWRRCTKRGPRDQPCQSVTNHNPGHPVTWLSQNSLPCRSERFSNFIWVSFSGEVKIGQSAFPRREQKCSEVIPAHSRSVHRAAHGSNCTWRNVWLLLHMFLTAGEFAVSPSGALLFASWLRSHLGCLPPWPGLLPPEQLPLLPLPLCGTFETRGADRTFDENHTRPSCVKNHYSTSRSLKLAPRRNLTLRGVIVQRSGGPPPRRPPREE